MEEANMQWASDQGNSQGNTDCFGDWSLQPSTLQSLNVEAEAQQQPQQVTSGEEETQDVTMKKNAVVKPNIIRKYSKQLSRKLLRRVGKVLPTEEEDISGIDEIELFDFDDPFANDDDEEDIKAVLPSLPTPVLSSSLPDDLVAKVTSFLDLPSLINVRECNRHLRDLASRNEAGWDNLCRRLWADKIHVPRIPKESPINPIYYMQAYPNSIRDAKARQCLTLDELCYDTNTHTGTIWSFRFKESAGTDWTSTDPWHNGLPCRKLVFLKDGCVRQYVPAACLYRSASSTSTTSSTANNVASSQASSLSQEVSDSESSIPDLIHPNFGSSSAEAQQQQRNLRTHNNNNNPHQQHQAQQSQRNAPSVNNNNPPGGRLVQPPVSMSWRFLTRPMDLPERPHGSYIRFSVGGREVPTYSVRRSPTQNWGFVMESCWGLYASFEMPPKRSPEQQQQAAQRRRLRRTETGARWVEVLDNGEETLASNPTSLAVGPTTRGRAASSLESSHTHTLSSPQELDDSALMDDSALVITNEIQWREAFLYNVGSRILPEGPEAASQFDRAFRGA